jgi:hypothetical protein
MVDIEANQLNTKGLLTELECCLNRIKVSSPCIIVYYRFCLILTSYFHSELNSALKKDKFLRVAIKRMTETQIFEDELK